MSQDTPTFLRWAGSKKKLIPEILTLCPTKHLNYIEPFAGSACVFFSLRPSSAVISDLNPHLIEMYRQIKSKPKIVSNYLQMLPIGKTHYYEIREQFSRSKPGPKKAAFFIYLNRYCFNGLYRTNAKGKFNVPYGGARTGPLPPEEKLCKAAGLLKHAKLYTGDFEAIVRATAQPSDLVYLDPPYFRGAARKYQYYGPKSFDSNDISRLTCLLSYLNEIGAYFIFSYEYSESMEHQLAKWRSYHVEVRRNISGFSDRRKLATELLSTNITA